MNLGGGQNLNCGNTCTKAGLGNDCERGIAMLPNSFVELMFGKGDFIYSVHSNILALLNHSNGHENRISLCNWNNYLRFGSALFYYCCWRYLITPQSVSNQYLFELPIFLQKNFDESVSLLANGISSKFSSKEDPRRMCGAFYQLNPMSDGFADPRSVCLVFHPVFAFPFCVTALSHDRNFSLSLRQQ